MGSSGLILPLPRPKSWSWKPIIQIGVRFVEKSGVKK
jgi:hypothetical protein